MTTADGEAGRPGGRGSADPGAPGGASGAGGAGDAQPADESLAPLPGTIAVIGLGLMGGSLARSLKALPSSPTVVGYATSEADTAAARAAEAVDHVAESEAEAVREADLVVYAVPLSALLESIPGLGDLLGDGTAVTDVASLLEPVASKARQTAGLADRWVAGHPMVGGEGSGFGASRVGLYRGAPVWLAEDTGDDEAHATVRGMWQRLGATPRTVAASEHDHRMVWASHLPQLASTALARALDGAGVEPEDLGPGGRDMTRLAASSPTMWHDLIRHAAARDAAALRVVAGELQALVAALESGHFEEVVEAMEATRRWRRGGRSP